MLPLGHTSAAYLVSQIPREKSKKKRLDWLAILFILFCGNIFDFDIFPIQLLSSTGGCHHFYITHTPLAGIIYLIIFYILLKKRFSKKVFVLAGLAMLSHLVLDDLIYWLTFLGSGRDIGPQIFWFYPFDPRLDIEYQKFLNYYSKIKVEESFFYQSYIMSKFFLLEILLGVAALFIFLRKKFTALSKSFSKK